MDAYYQDEYYDDPYDEDEGGAWVDYQCERCGYEWDGFCSSRCPNCVSWGVLEQFTLYGNPETAPRMYRHLSGLSSRDIYLALCVAADDGINGAMAFVDHAAIESQFRWGLGKA